MSACKTSGGTRDFLFFAMFFPRSGGALKLECHGEKYYIELPDEFNMHDAVFGVLAARRWWAFVRTARSLMLTALCIK